MKLEIDNTVSGNGVYTKETPESLPFYLGTMKLIDGIWNLVSTNADGNIVTFEYDSTAVETLKMLNYELKLLSLEDVQKLSDFNIKNIGKIISF